MSNKTKADTEKELYTKQRDDYNLKKKDFIDKMAQIESSGGIDTDHDRMTSGIHEGSSAYGTYGLMPNTIRELANRARLTSSPETDVKSLRQLEDEQIKQRLSENPELEKRLADRMADLVFKKQKGDEERAAQAWQYGHNRQYSNKEIEDSERIAKFRKLKSLIKN